MCGACIEELERKLRQLPHIRLALRSFLGGMLGTALTSKVSSTATPACPLDVHVDALRDEIGDVIDRTANLRVHDLVRVPEMDFVIWSAGRIEAKKLDGVARALDIRRVHAKANRFLGFDPVWQQRHAPCPGCGEGLLGNWVGDDHVSCRGCGTSLTLDEYESYCEDLLEGL